MANLIRDLLSRLLGVKKPVVRNSFYDRRVRHLTTGLNAQTSGGWCEGEVKDSKVDVTAVACPSLTLTPFNIQPTFSAVFSNKYKRLKERRLGW